MTFPMGVELNILDVAVAAHVASVFKVVAVMWARVRWCPCTVLMQRQFGGCFIKAVTKFPTCARECWAYGTGNWRKRNLRPCLICDTPNYEC